MSRSLRILNMLKENNNLPESCAHDLNASSVGNHTNINAVILEHGTLSPLPPGAEEISLELNGIWENLLREENKEADAMFTVINSRNIQDDKKYPITPLTLEAPSSFKHSPMIAIEDLDIADFGSSGISMEQQFSTPLPSPLNIHSTCHSEFCATHEKILSPISSSPATPQSTEYSEIPKTTKKRPRRQKEWIDVKRKRLMNLGQKYVTKSGVLKNEKTLGLPCKCRYQCFDKISYVQRMYCFSNFWKLGDRSTQWNFIIKYSDKMKKKRCLNSSTPNNRKYTYTYFLPLTSDSNDNNCRRVKVCQTMFVNTLAFTTRMVKTAWSKYDGSAVVEKDKRGSHDKHKTVITDEMVQSVCDHVRAFAPVESHYIRKDSKKLYLNGDLSIAKMYKLYLNWYDEKTYTCKAYKERQYRDIVNSNFNLAFHIPKKDQCDECHIFRQKKNPTEEELKYFTEHKNNKKIARDLKNQDKKEAADSNKTILAAVFDFQKVLTCPHGNVSILYYKRKLSCLNFTVFDIGERKAVCYMWDETVAKRGANEVSSCLLEFIQNNVKQGVKEFRFWSDNCAGQNRNRIVFSLYDYAAKKFNISITHRFLEKGHTQNEGDSVHSVIERASQTKIIYTPHEWRLLARWAKIEGEPYVVRNMTQKDFYDFKSHINNKVWLKNIKGAKIAWTSIKEVHANSTDSNKLFYKYDLTLKDYDVLILRGNTRNSLDINLKTSYTEPIKLPLAKYKDLVSMCQSGVIPSEYSSFFNSLPHHINDNKYESSDNE